MNDVKIFIIAYEKITIRIHIIAFVTVEDGTLPQEKELVIYLYPAYQLR